VKNEVAAWLLVRAVKFNDIGIKKNSNPGETNALTKVVIMLKTS
jgi:hypothetical protein